MTETTEEGPRGPSSSSPEAKHRSGSPEDKAIHRPPEDQAIHRPSETKTLEPVDIAPQPDRR